MKNIRKKTLSFKMNLLNILVDTNEDVNIFIKNIESIKVSKLIDFKENKFINNVFPKFSKR